MATKLYFRVTSCSFDRYVKTNNKAGSAVYWTTKNLSTSAGASVTSYTATSVTGPTAGLECISGLAAEWFSDPLAADVTISGTIAHNLWTSEGHAAANASVACLIQRINCTDLSLSTISDTADNVELGTSAAAMTWNNASPTSTACNKGDRIRAVVYFDDDHAESRTMGSGRTLTFRFDYDVGNTADSWISFNETITFGTASGAQYIYPTSTASDLATADIDYKAWTSRGT